MEDLARLRRRRAIELVLDGRIDIAAERGSLNLLIDREQPPQQIAGLLAFRIERHRHLHLEVFDENRLEDRDAQRVDIVIGAQPHDQRGKQGQRVW